MQQKKFLTLLFLSSVVVLSVLFLLTVLQSKKDARMFVQNTTGTVIDSKSGIPTSSRRTLTRMDLEELSSMFPNACEYSPVSASFYEPQTEWVTYVNKEKGIEMEIPFNPIWGYLAFSLNPFDLTKDGVMLFGEVGGVAEGGCASWANVYQMEFANTESAEKIISRLEQEYGAIGTDPYYLDITTTTVGGKTVVAYTMGGMDGAGQFVVIGKKSNYIFSTLKFDSELYQDIVERIKLID